MPNVWSIRCGTHIKTPTKGSLVEVIVSAGDERFARFFPLSDVNTNPVGIYRWLGECGVVATADIKKGVVAALSDRPAAIDGWAADTPGWYGKFFVLPTRTIGGGPHNIINMMVGTNTGKWKKRGNLKSWKAKVASPAAGSPVAVFALSATFAGPILELAGAVSLVFMVVGPNSVGKSTLMEVCGSVWGGGGGESFSETFLRSPEEFETAALHHRDTFLGLDETQLLGSTKRDAGEKFHKILFRYSSEKAKRIYGIQSSNQSLRGVRCFTSNKTAAELLGDASQRFAGQEAVRIAEIIVDPNEFPIFIFDGGNTLKNARRVERLKSRSRRFCGSSSRVFLKHLVKDRVRDEVQLIKRVERYIDEAMALFDLPPHVDSMVVRLARQIAIAYAAGRLAYHYGALPFRPKLLRKAFSTLWPRIHQQAVESIGHDPVPEFVRGLSESLTELIDLDKGLPTLTASEAKQSAGFMKTQKDRRLAIFLPGTAFARLAPVEEPVLRWLEDQGYLVRDRKLTTAGHKVGKRQVKVVVGHKPNGSNVRLRLYKLVGDLSEMRRAAGVPHPQESRQRDQIN